MKKCTEGSVMIAIENKNFWRARYGLKFLPSGNVGRGRLCVISAFFFGKVMANKVVVKHF
jgi:hypothetical protein